MLNSIDFDIYKFKKNSSTLPIFKSFPEIIDFDIEKNKLIQDMLVAKNGGAKTQKPVRKKAVEFHCETLD